MSHVLKKSKASFANLKARAELLEKTRAFFKQRGVLEIDTPLLCPTAGTDLQLEPFTVPVPFKKTDFYLQTSPEFAMKRLLASGIGSIYQICKAFRQDEVGQRHNPEFTMLEWYRVGFDHHQLIDEVKDFLCETLNVKHCEKIAYYSLFTNHFQLDLNDIQSNYQEGSFISLEILQSLVLEYTTFSDAHTLDVSSCYDLLFSMVIEPTLGKEYPVVVYDYPIEQKALAKTSYHPYPCAQRFEVYYKGVELANGYHELLDADEQRSRFLRENELRLLHNKKLINIDEQLLKSMHTMPQSAGVALGFDRLCMLALSAKSLSEVISFDFEQL